ncbi:hypothetical protein AB0P32_32865 [Streptomyces sp. NPDC085995]|uniref:hypothetical protein n=1 Tax=Streptomyces sp. NPDC085995 TaxID=3154861 RepID=UPI0034191B90
MTRPRAEVGDLVEDADGHHAIVTDIKQNSTWILRPVSGGTTTQWETNAPDALRVLKTRADRLSRKESP